MAAAPTEAEGNRRTTETSSGIRLWPVLIIGGLILVVLVNAIFIYIAVSGADDVVPSYVTEER